MFKRIKDYFYLQRAIQIEILETLCTICLWLERDGHHNPYSQYMGSHFRCLKELSKVLMEKELSKELREKEK